MTFCLDDFKLAILNGFLKPYSLSYDYVDEQKYEMFRKDIEWKDNKIAETFQELRKRMSRKYFREVLLAQVCALDYATLQFPSYSFMLSEDLSDDWLAIVDFHKKHTRDHSLHQPLTAYITAQLLGFGDSAKALSIPREKGNLLDFCVSVVLEEKAASYILDYARKYGLPETLMQKDSIVAREFWQGLFYQTAVLSALFHDLGYPWQYVDRVGAALRRSVTTLHQSDSLVNKVIEEFMDRMVFLPLRNYQSEHDTESVFEKDEETIAYWDTVIETGRIRRALIDIFFDAYFQMFTQNRKYQISTEDRISYNRIDRLALSYQHFINNYCGGDKSVILKDLKHHLLNA